jgi:hypothetical protein
LDRSRDPKRISEPKATVPEVDYKIEQGDFDAGYEYEDEAVQVKAKGQPQRGPSDEDVTVEEDQDTPIVSPSPSTSAPTVSSTSSDADSKSTMGKSHPDSVNSPIILKQSNLLQSVPASRFHPSNAGDIESRPTSPVTTPSTTTTTEAPASEAVSSARPSGSRFRGQQRVRGNSVTPREQPVSTAATTAAAPEHEEEVAQQRPAVQRTPNRLISYIREIESVQIYRRK